MATDNRSIHFKNFADFNVMKLSANEDNTTYTVGIDGTVTSGTPEINYQQVCWIKDTQQIWTHGQIYNCSGGSGSDSNGGTGDIIELSLDISQYYYDEHGSTDFTMNTSLSEVGQMVDDYCNHLMGFELPEDVEESQTKYRWTLYIRGGDDSIGRQVTPAYIDAHAGDDRLTLYYTLGGTALYSLTLYSSPSRSPEFSIVSGGAAYTQWTDGVKYPEGGKLYHVLDGALDVMCYLLLSNFAENDTCVISIPATSDCTITFSAGPDTGVDTPIYLDTSVESAASATSGRVVYCIQRIGYGMYITASNFTAI